MSGGRSIGGLGRGRDMRMLTVQRAERKMTRGESSLPIIIIAFLVAIALLSLSHACTYARNHYRIHRLTQVSASEGQFINR